MKQKLRAEKANSEPHEVYMANFELTGLISLRASFKNVAALFKRQQFLRFSLLFLKYSGIFSLQTPS